MVTGATGTLGGAMLTSAAQHGEVIGASRSAPSGERHGDWTPLDIRDGSAVDAVVDSIRPDLIINCAAVVGDWATTAHGPIHLARAAARHGAQLVQISTDAVFASSTAPYREDDLPCPVTLYGAAKAAAELALTQAHPNAAIVRTSLIVSHDGRTGREREVHQAIAQPGTRMFYTDEVRCPVALMDLAGAVWEIARAGRRGVHHVAGSDAISRYELARLIAERDGLDPTRLTPAARGGRPGAAVIKLDCSRTQRALTTTLRGANEFLATDPGSPG